MTKWRNWERRDGDEKRKKGERGKRKGEGECRSLTFEV